MKSANAGSAIAKERAAAREQKKLEDNNAMLSASLSESERVVLRKQAVRAMYDRMRSVRKSLRAGGARTNIVEEFPDA